MNRHLKIGSPKLPQMIMQIKNRLGCIYNIKYLPVTASYEIGQLAIFSPNLKDSLGWLN